MADDPAEAEVSAFGQLIYVCRTIRRVPYNSPTFSDIKAHLSTYQSLNRRWKNKSRKKNAVSTQQTYICSKLLNFYPKLSDNDIRKMYTFMLSLCGHVDCPSSNSLSKLESLPVELFYKTCNMLLKRDTLSLGQVNTLLYVETQRKEFLLSRLYDPFVCITPQLIYRIDKILTRNDGDWLVRFNRSLYTHSFYKSIIIENAWNYAAGHCFHDPDGLGVDLNDSMIDKFAKIDGPCPWIPKLLQNASNFEICCESGRADTLCADKLPVETFFTSRKVHPPQHNRYHYDKGLNIKLFVNLYEPLPSFLVEYKKLCKENAMTPKKINKVSVSAWIGSSEDTITPYLLCLNQNYQSLELDCVSARMNIDNVDQFYRIFHTDLRNIKLFLECEYDYLQITTQTIDKIPDKKNQNLIETRRSRMNVEKLHIEFICCNKAWIIKGSSSEPQGSQTPHHHDFEKALKTFKTLTSFGHDKQPSAWTKLLDLKRTLKKLHVAFQLSAYDHFICPKDIKESIIIAKKIIDGSLEDTSNIYCVVQTKAQELSNSTKYHRLKSIVIRYAFSDQVLCGKTARAELLSHQIPDWMLTIVSDLFHYIYESRDKVIKSAIKSVSIEVDVTVVMRDRDITNEDAEKKESKELRSSQSLIYFNDNQPSRSVDRKKVKRVVVARNEWNETADQVLKNCTDWMKNQLKLLYTQRLLTEDVRAHQNEESQVVQLEFV